MLLITYEKKAYSIHCDKLFVSVIHDSSFGHVRQNNLITQSLNMNDSRLLFIILVCYNSFIQEGVEDLVTPLTKLGRSNSFI